MTTYTDRQKACIDRIRDALPEFTQQDDYLLSHGASLMSDNSHEIIHVDTLRKIVEAVLRTPALASGCADGDERTFTWSQEFEDWLDQGNRCGANHSMWKAWQAARESTSPFAGFSEAMQDEREFHEAVVSLVRDMMNAMQNEHFWSDVPELHVRVNALLTAPLPRAVASQPGAPAEPIPMLLFCPNCGEQHIDAPEPADADIDVDGSVISATSAWDNPPHRSHLCHACGAVWRPADVPTTGVASIATKGKADTWDGVESFFEPDVGEFKWPRLPDFPQSFAHVAGHAYFTEHQMQGYANAYGEIVRATLAAAKPVSVDAGGMMERETLGKVLFALTERQKGNVIRSEDEYVAEARALLTPPTESTGEPQ